MNAYSRDLRNKKKKKVVEALGRGATKSEAARSFGVSRSSVKRYAKKKKKKMAEDGYPLARPKEVSRLRSQDGRGRQEALC